MAKILILGGGFAAIAAAEILAKGIGDQDEITVVSKSDRFVFFPGLVPFVFDKVKLNEIYFDLRKLLQRRKVRFARGEVIDLDLNKKNVRMVSGPADEILSFDFLLIAIGRRIKVDAIPGFYEYSNHILNPGAALVLKQAVANLDAGSIIVGLCPGALLPIPICEIALGLADRFRKQIDRGDISIKIVFPATLEKALAGSGLFRDLETEFERKRVTLVCDFAVTNIYKTRLAAATGSQIDYDLLVLMPAFSGQDFFSAQNAITDSEGFVQVNEKMQVAGFDQIFAAGDMISLSGPRFGYMALRQGKVAAENILAELHNKEPKAQYKHEIEWIIGERYTDPIFFHYGVWDETLEDFDENALFGMAKLIRKRYGTIKVPPDEKPFPTHRFKSKRL